ncbi:MAG: hypothetical protein Q8Q09_19770 [Deltaproteobacteria bacterium]|nr:hypothetical protein [Deltaproteobacteria bacterium]
MQAPTTLTFVDQQPVRDPVSGRNYLLRLRGQFVGHGIDAREVATMQQWLGQACFASLSRFRRPLTELSSMLSYWNTDVNALVAPVFMQHFRAQGVVSVLALELLDPPTQAPAPAPAPPPATATAARAVTPAAPAPVILEGPAIARDPWVISLGDMTDAPTGATVCPEATVTFDGPALDDARERDARALAMECVRAAVLEASAKGESVLDLLLFASKLNGAIEQSFGSEVSKRARVKGTLRLDAIHLSQEDATQLRDLYAQIAIARGGR